MSIATTAANASQKRIMKHPMPRPDIEAIDDPTPSPLVLLVKVLIRGYRFAISPLLGPRCRHLPTCSEFALEAFERHGFWRGMGLSIGRILRCHPWGTSGYDPVP